MHFIQLKTLKPVQTTRIIKRGNRRKNEMERTFARRLSVGSIVTADFDGSCWAKRARRLSYFPIGRTSATADVEVTIS